VELGIALDQMLEMTRDLIDDRQRSLLVSIPLEPIILNADPATAIAFS
jgi:hypothetical protein